MRKFGHLPTFRQQWNSGLPGRRLSKLRHIDIYIHCLYSDTKNKLILTVNAVVLSFHKRKKSLFEHTNVPLHPLWNSYQQQLWILYKSKENIIKLYFYIICFTNYEMIPQSIDPQAAVNKDDQVHMSWHIEHWNWNQL